VNLYGPGDNFDLDTSHVIPALIRRFSEARARGDREVVLWGTGNASREFLYVEDAARGIVAATMRYEDPDPVNLGSGTEITIRDLAAKIQHLTGYQGNIVWDSTKPDGQPRRCLDVARAAVRFGWRARVSLDEGLKQTIEWYRREFARPT
jgi:GDP-L-fucose synthase